MNASPSLPRRRFAATVGALGLTSALTMSGLVGEGVSVTEAQWSDTEVVKAQVTASWADGGWSRSTSNAYTNYGSFPERSGDNTTHIRIDDRPSANYPYTRDHYGSFGNSWAVGDNFGLFTPGDRPATNIQFCNYAADPGTVIRSDPKCEGKDGPEYQQDFAQSRAKGWGLSGGFANPSSDADEPILWVEAQGVSTMAQCSPEGDSIATAPQTNGPPWGNAIGFIANHNLLMESNRDHRYRTISPITNKTVRAWIRPQVRKNVSDSAFVESPAYFHVSLTSRAYETFGYALSDIFLTIDQFSVKEGNEYLGSFTLVLSRSECGVKIGGEEHKPLQVEFDPINAPAYSEKPTSDEAVIIYEKVTAPTPDAEGNVPTTASRFSAFTHRSTSSTTGAIPPAITVTSPTEHTTASETTTSAPPNPDDPDAPTNQTSARTTTSKTFISTSTTTSTTKATGSSTTTPAPTKMPTSSAVATAVPTSETPSSSPGTTTQPSTTEAPPTSTAAPEIVIPDDPGTLDAAARTELVDTVSVGESEVDVVVGNSIPTDARAGARALETWLDGGTPSTTWATFTSDDPDRDGWRWAAISQRTGTVVYIR